MSTATCTHCDAETTHDSDLCEVHHAERELVAEHPTACACWGCAKWFPRHTGLMARYRATAKAHPATVALCHRLPRIAAMITAGAILTVVDHAELGARCDAAREAWIAAIEAEGTVVCTCCGKTVPWYAVDTDGRCSDCPAAARRAA